MESEGPKADVRAQGSEAENKAGVEPGAKGDALGDLSVDDREKREERLRASWLGPLLAGRLESIRRGVTKLFDDHKHQPPMPGFTPHGAQHCRSVEALIYRLIPGDRYRKLREYERYLLLASAWVHDLGMISGLLGGDDSVSSLEDVRARHHERSEEFIVNNPARCGIQDECDAPVLGLLARLHGGGIKTALESQNVGGHDVRIQLIAGFLCLADALHIDASRAPSDAYAICLAYDVPVASKVHWIKSRFVSGIKIEPDHSRIVLQFKRPNPTQEAELKRQGVDIEGIRKIHQLVIQEVRNNLSAIQEYLGQGEVARYEKVTSEETPMLLDRQVLRDLRMVVNNPDFLANPSASRLAELMLRTVADILEIDERGVPRPVSPKEQRTQRKKVQAFFNRLEDEVLRQRPCHLSLMGLLSALREHLEASERRISSLEGEAFRRPNLAEWGGKGAHPYQFSGGSVISRKLLQMERPLGLPRVESGGEDPLVRFVNRKLESQKRRRRRVRLAGQRYLEDFFTNPENTPPELIRDWRRRPVTVLLFGYSELVIKALCGFRDFVLRHLMVDYLLENPDWGTRGQEVPRKGDWVAFQEPGGMDFLRPFHLQNLERMASDHFRIFVCSGEPKNASETTEELGFQEGFHYAESLARHGFTNIIRVPDMLGAGNLLHRTWDEGGPLESFMRLQAPGAGPQAPKDPLPKDPMVDFVLMGVNGVGILNRCEAQASGASVRFKHGAGHLAMATAVAGLTETYRGSGRFTRLPRMVFVASCDKFMLQDTVGLERKHQESLPDWLPKGSDQIWSWLPADVQTSHGFWIQKGFYGEAVRDKPFPLPHRGQVELFREAGIRLYNPREEVVWPALVDDLIWDDGFYRGEDPMPVGGRGPEAIRRGQVVRIPHPDVSVLMGDPLAKMKDLSEVARWVTVLHWRVRRCCLDHVPVRASKALDSHVVEWLGRQDDVEILGDPLEIPDTQDGRKPNRWLYHVRCWSGQRGYVRAEDLGLWGEILLPEAESLTIRLYEKAGGSLPEAQGQKGPGSLELVHGMELILFVQKGLTQVNGPEVWQLVGTADGQNSVKVLGWILESDLFPRVEGQGGVSRTQVLQARWSPRVEGPSTDPGKGSRTEKGVPEDL